ncbi:MAG: type II secretion system F family protein [Acidobacteriota bacterium]
MSFYAYEVVDRYGGIVNGKIEADNEHVAADRLRKMGLTVVEVSEVKKSPFEDFLKTGPKVTVGDLAIMSRQMSAMMDAGLPLTRALHTVADQADNSTMKAAVKSCASSVEGGISLADSLKVHPDIFPPLYIDMIAAGEASGSLVEVLTRLAVQLEQDKALRDQIKAATFYPAAVGIFALLIVLAMMLFVVPIFMKYFPPNVPLKIPTRIVVGISTSLRSFWYIWILVCASIYGGITYYLKSPTGHRQWDAIKYRLPVFGKLAQKTMVARFSRTLSTLLEGGIPVLQALESAGPTTGNLLVADAIAIAAEKIQEGQSISKPLADSGLFPPILIQMVAVGEESGSLPFLLSRVAEFYEEEVSTMSKGLTAMLEPIMIIFVGSIVGFIVISIYLPIFTVVTSIGGK